MLAGREILAVDLLRNLVELGLAGVLVVERQGQDRVGELAALPLVKPLHSLEEVSEDPVVVPGMALVSQDLVLPLRPPAAVDERAVLLDPVGGLQHEDLGLDLAGVYPRCVPEL